MEKLDDDHLTWGWKRGQPRRNKTWLRDKPNKIKKKLQNMFSPGRAYILRWFLPFCSVQSFLSPGGFLRFERGLICSYNAAEIMGDYDYGYVAYGTYGCNVKTISSFFRPSGWSTCPTVIVHSKIRYKCFPTWGFNTTKNAKRFFFLLLSINCGVPN